MSAKFFQFKKNLFLAILLLVIFVLPNNALAENLLTVGSANSNLTGTDSAIFSNIGSISATTTSLIRLQKNGVDLFKVDSTGNVTMGNFLTSISAANVSSGAFGSLSGNGNYSFPGNVGIGTTTPAARLNIYSTSSIEEMFRLSDASGSSAANKYINWYSNNGGTTLTDFARIGAGYGSDYINSFMAFSVADGARVLRERVRINVNGNVGIGTTAPASKLHIFTGTDSDVGNGLRLFGSNPDGVRLTAWSNDAGNYSAIYSWDENDGGTGSFATLRLGNSTDGTKGINIIPSGNVGIGNPSPGYKLDVNGEANFGIGTTTNRLHNVSAPTYGTDAANKNYVDSAITPPATTTAGIQSGFWTTGANGSIFNNNSSGKVGIGTMTPNSKLDIFSGNLELDAGYGLRSGNANVGVSFPVDNQLKLQSYSDLLFNGYNGSSYVTNMVIKQTSGNVGIGTTTPGSLLTVGNNLGLTLGGTIYGATASRYLDFTGVLPLSLSVPGPIKFGNTATACDSTNTGALRYDAVSGQSYLCDGSRWVNQKNCGLMTDDEGNSYNTVQIGGQCWMAENINIGTMLASGSTMPNTADQVIEKWCYNSDPANCAANGGLYHFDEAVRGSKVSGARGICPAGWHVPTDAEFNVLEKTVSGIIASAAAQYPCNLSVTGWRRCADDNAADNGGPSGVGKSLKAVGVGGGNGAGNNLVGFEGKLSGSRSTDSSFLTLGSYLFLWSSSPSGSSYAWRRRLSSSYSSVLRNASNRAGGFSVRCVRD